MAALQKIRGTLPLHLQTSSHGGEETESHKMAKGVGHIAEGLVNHTSDTLGREAGEQLACWIEILGHPGATGHDSFREFAKRIQEETTGTCQYCGRTGTTEHTVSRCDRWPPKRQRNKESLTINRQMLQSIIETKEREKRLCQASKMSLLFK